MHIYKTNCSAFGSQKLNNNSTTNFETSIGKRRESKCCRSTKSNSSSLRCSEQNRCWIQDIKISNRKDGDLNAVDKENETLFHCAVKNDSISGLKMLKLLLEKGGNSNVVNQLNQTPLH